MNDLIDDESAAEAERLARHLRWGVALRADRMGGHSAGLQRGRRLGSSGEFEGYRRFLPDEDLRALDLRVYARLRRRVARVSREDSSQSVTLLLDQSASLGTGARPRAQALLSALFVALAQRHGDPVRIFLHGGGRLWPARVPTSAAAWNALLVPTAPRSPSDWARELRALPPDPAGRGLVISITDALGLAPPEPPLAALARHGRVTLCMLLEDSECDPPYDGRVLLRSREDEPSWRGAITADTRAEYRRQLAAYQRRLRHALAALGGDLQVLHASGGLATLVETLRRHGSLLR